MKKVLSALFLCAALVLVPSAFAGSITGNVIVTGYGETWNASSITFAAPGTTLYSDGTLAVSNSTAATMTSFSFVPPGSANNIDLFTLPNGEEFLIEGITFDQESDTFINITGWGYLLEPGYDQTLGGFSLTGTKNQTTSYTLDVSVAPEPSSLLLLGTGLLGLGMLLRRKLAI